MALTLNGSTGISGIAGSAGTPALQGNNDANTGYFFAADTLGLSTAGSERLRIDSTGRIGIGTNSPAYFISIENAAPYIRVKDTAAPTDEKIWDFNAGTDGILRFRNTNDAANSSNNWLEVERDGVTTSSIRLLTASGSERLRIDSNGDVIIGASSSTTVTGAGTPLQVSGSDGYTGMSIIRTASSGAQFQFAAGSNGDNVSDNDGLGYFKFFGYHTNGYDEYARIHSEVSGTNGDGDAPGALVFSTTADAASSVSERMRIDHTGGLMVGTTSTRTAEFTHPDGFSIRGDVKGQFQSTVDANSCGFLNRDSSDGAVLSFRREGADVGHIGVTGTTTYLQFGGTNNAAHQLDDYEEGTFTPGIDSGTVNVVRANYTKIGNLVHIQCYLNTFSDHTSNDAILITNLPFSSSSKSAAVGSVITAYFANSGSIEPYMGTSSTSMYFFTYGDGTDYASVKHSAITAGDSVRRAFFTLIYEAT